MSAILCRAIAAGRPVIITDLPEWGFLPEDFCLRVAPDEHEVDNIAQHLRRLAADPAERERRAGAARAYYQQSGTVAQMARGYQSVIDHVLGRRSGDPPLKPVSEIARQPALGKVCDVEDFADPELAGLIREIFPNEVPAAVSKGELSHTQVRFWQAAIAVRSLRRFDLLHERARLLTIGAEAQVLSYYLAQHAAQVMAVDDYLGQDVPGPAILAGLFCALRLRRSTSHGAADGSAPSAV
jgi:hypothetical protein